MSVTLDARSGVPDTPPDTPSDASPDAWARMERMVRDRAALGAAFARVSPMVRRQGGTEAFARATLELAHVNAGPACVVAFWQVAAASCASACAGARGAAAVCRLAGSRAALACLEALPLALRLTRGDAPALAGWWQGLTRLARDAPLLVAGAAARVEALLADGDGLAFADFVAAGLKLTMRDRAARERFFRLEDARARAMLAGRGTDGFAQAEIMLRAFAGALWGGEPRLLATPGTETRRAMIASGTVLLPPVFAGVPATRARDLYRAAVAHAHAHLAVPAVCFPVETLRPLQLALIGVIEDARVEALAIRRAPGLRRLWASFHEARPDGATTAAALMARLSRALLDPDYADPDGFVARGRSLFTQLDTLDDPAMSRRIGGLLGNDLGQMRVQFDARSYATEPAYRDDNAHLWDYPDAPDDALAMSVDAARPTGDGGGEGQPGDGDPAPRARPAGVDAHGTLIATYPEWDLAANTERPGWTSLRDTVPSLASPPAATADAATLGARVRKLVRASVIGRHVRQARREDGEALDLDAAIAAAVERRAGRTPDARVYRDRRPTERDLSTLIILDTSQSMAAPGLDGRPVLDWERAAVSALAQALAARGEPFAVRAFASSGREDVRLTRLKDFAEPFGPAFEARLAGLRPGLSTRLGAALRHAGAELAPLRTARKLVLVMTDGEPSDIDVPDARELVEDARRATLSLRLRGVDVFGVIMDPARAGSGLRIFGRHNAMVSRRLEDLPATLAGVYFRLARR